LLNLCVVKADELAGSYRGCVASPPADSRRKQPFAVSEAAAAAAATTTAAAAAAEDTRRLSRLRSLSRLAAQAFLQQNSDNSAE